MEIQRYRELREMAEGDEDIALFEVLGDDRLGRHHGRCRDFQR